MERIFRNVSEGQSAPEAKINDKKMRMNETKFFDEEWLSRFDGLASKESRLRVDFMRLEEIARQRGKEFQLEEIDSSNFSARYYVNMSRISTSMNVRRKIEMDEISDALAWGAAIIFDQNDLDLFGKMYECTSSFFSLAVAELEAGQVVIVDSEFRRRE